MRSWTAALLLFTGMIAVATTANLPQSLAQAPDKPADPVEESIPTADGISLRGLFHKCDKGGNAPVVILLYPPGKDQNMTKGGWAGLAQRLNKEGYHVFRFDWRGHGKSTEVTDTKLFWSNPVSGPWNKLANPTNPKKGAALKTDFLVKDLGQNLVKYYPAFVNDLAAVRAHLDQKNDNGELNTSSIYVIGAGDAASLGLFWIAAEWNRPGVYAAQPGVAGYELVPDARFPLGTDTAGSTIPMAVWLSPNHPPSIPDQVIKKWASTAAPKMRDNNHMLMLFGDKDMVGKKQSDFLYESVLVGRGNPGLGFDKIDARTQVLPIEKAGTLSGEALLGGPTGQAVEDVIIKYLGVVQKNQAKVARKQRNWTAPYLIHLPDFGIPRP